MKRLTNVIQIVAVLLAAFFIVCLFTSQFPPWKSDDNGGGSAAAATTVLSTGTTVTGGAATSAAASTADGKALYEANCATCHGKTGGGGFGPSLKGIQNNFSEEQETSIIKSGQGSMPGFGQLSAEEIAAIVAYTRTLG